MPLYSQHSRLKSGKKCNFFSKIFVKLIYLIWQVFCCALVMFISSNRDGPGSIHEISFKIMFQANFRYPKSYYGYKNCHNTKIQKRAIKESPIRANSVDFKVLLNFELRSSFIMQHISYCTIFPFLALYVYINNFPFPSQKNSQSLPLEFILIKQLKSVLYLRFCFSMEKIYCVCFPSSSFSPTSYLCLLIILLKVWYFEKNWSNH